MALGMLEQYNPTVLICEPARHFVPLLRHILSVGKVRNTQHAGDAYEALEIIKTNHVDIMLLDSEVTGITAFELARVVRRASDSPCPNLPIVLMCNYPTRRLLTEAKEEGIDFYVRKPLSAQTLLQRMKWALEAERQRFEKLRNAV